MQHFWTPRGRIFFTKGHHQSASPREVGRNRAQLGMKAGPGWEVNRDWEHGRQMPVALLLVERGGKIVYAAVWIS
jgi:hypothetical protein